MYWRLFRASLRRGSTPASGAIAGKMDRSSTWKCSCTRCEYSGRTAALVVAQDITERKRAEEGRQKFFTLVENSRDFIAVADLQRQRGIRQPRGPRHARHPGCGVGEGNAFRRLRDAGGSAPGARHDFAGAPIVRALGGGIALPPSRRPAAPAHGFCGISGEGSAAQASRASSPPFRGT